MTTGAMIMLLSALVVFATFFHILVNARSVAKVAKDVDPADVTVGPGSDRKTAGKGAIIASIILHFLGWGGMVYGWMLMGGVPGDTSAPAATAEGTAPVATNRDMGPATPVTSAPPAQAGTQQNNGAAGGVDPATGTQPAPGAANAAQAEKKSGY